MTVIQGSDYTGLLPKRQPDGHKGDYGHVLILGGSAGFGGAPALAALGALRSGAGLVSAALPASLVNGPVAALAPETMAHPIEEYAGHILANAFLNWLYARKPFSTIAVGPGLGQTNETAEIIRTLLKIHERSLVLDADALNIIAADENGLAAVAEAPAGKRILTPHHMEAARLLGCSVEEVLKDRESAALTLAEKTGGVVVLKGHDTIVCESGRPPAVCLAGNPGMATGGSGDVLSGVIAALWGQGLSAFDAAALGVWVHATAGDFARDRFGEISMTARDIADNLHLAFKAMAAGD